MSDIKKIGIITSGGDCGGLNAVIYGIAKIAIANNVEPVIIPNGYAGLYNLDVINPLTIEVNNLDHFSSAPAGSIAGHSRVKISRINDENKWEKITSNLKKHNIDALIISGGDDTGSVVLDLIEHNVRCIHIPKTMDMDLQTYSVGGDSTISRISRFINELRTTGLTHNRIIVMEVFGRYAGHTAFRGGVGADADCILIPEIPVELDVVYNHFKKVFSRKLENDVLNSATYSIVVAEGITNTIGEVFSDGSAGLDSFGHRRLSGAGAFVRQMLQGFAKEDADYWKEIFTKNGVYVEGINVLPEIRDLLPGHLVRCGDSSPYDISFGKQCGGAAVLMLLNGISGVTVAGIVEGEIRYLPIKNAIAQRKVNIKDVELFEQMGICFGRQPAKVYAPNFQKVNGSIERYM
jgi:6-phosphofructokinase 1